ncbi:hypothetical protein RRG08_061009 [Elysia crispata]|uniref:Uncharacterized protein n=1 Tax=Elysia crispata TaxID=231223 RepID=A0AAE1E4R4_9GAST|nr:hypothetical protein RRG08_061009 [Elysia crispata]
MCTVGPKCRSVWREISFCDLIGTVRAHRLMSHFDTAKPVTEPFVVRWIYRTAQSLRCESNSNPLNRLFDALPSYPSPHTLKYLQNALKVLIAPCPVDNKRWIVKFRYINFVNLTKISDICENIDSILHKLNRTQYPLCLLHFTSRTRLPLSPSLYSGIIKFAPPLPHFGPAEGVEWNNGVGSMLCLSHCEGEWVEVAAGGRELLSCSVLSSHVQYSFKPVLTPSRDLTPVFYESKVFTVSRSPAAVAPSALFHAVMSSVLCDTAVPCAKIVIAVTRSVEQERSRSIQV